MKCWIIGRKATIAPNGHSYIAEPFIVFSDEAEADSACDMIERVSGERPMKTDGALYNVKEVAHWNPPSAEGGEK